MDDSSILTIGLPLLRELVLLATGTFFGAWIAFKLERSSLRREERAQEASGVKATLFTLAMQRAFVKNLLELYLTPQARRPERWRKLGPFLRIPAQDELDLRGLSYLLDTGESDLLHQLAHGQNQYRSLLGLIDARNEMHEHLVGRLEQVGDHQGRLPEDPQELDELVGPSITEPLKGLTDALYESAEISLRANADDVERLERYFAEAFPNDSPPSLRIPRFTGTGIAAA